MTLPGLMRQTGRRPLLAVAVAVAAVQLHCCKFNGPWTGVAEARCLIRRCGPGHLMAVDGDGSGVSSCVLLPSIHPVCRGAGRKATSDVDLPLLTAEHLTLSIRAPWLKSAAKQACFKM